MNMKRKLVYLPNEYSKDVVDNINGYFDKGYEIENIFNANEGVYILLVLNVTVLRSAIFVLIHELLVVQAFYPVIDI